MKPMCINGRRAVCSVLRVVHVHVRDGVLVVHRIVLKRDVVMREGVRNVVAICTAFQAMGAPAQGLHPESFTTFCSTPPPPPQTTYSTNPERASLTGIRPHLSATSLGRQSGYLTDSIPLTARFNLLCEF